MMPARPSVQIVQCLLALLLCGVAGAQEPKVRTSLATKGDLWTGQRATLVVELLAPGFFAGTAVFDLPNVPGLLLAPPSGSPVVSSETLDGASYTVQRHEISIFARRGGEQIVPTFAVRFRFKRAPLDRESVAATVKSEPVRFTVKLPPGAEKLGNLISARELEVGETWSPEPGQAKPGDAFTRTIVFTAPDIPAMAFPPFPSGRIDGLGVYPKAPEVLDHRERGSLRGERRDVITYVCQRPGQFTMPAVRMTWFDLDAQKLRTIDFPARALVVAANPALAKSAVVGPQRISMDWGIALFPMAVATLFLLAAAGRTQFHRAIGNLLAPLRPVHLQPLNPAPKDISRRANS